MKTTLILSGLASALVLSACAPMAADDGAVPPSDSADQCKAGQDRNWVGRNRSELPSAPAGEVWRVTCSTCAVTMDYNPRRLNIVFDQATGVIEDVKCG